jgi:hypothetical protein
MSNKRVTIEKPDGQSIDVDAEIVNRFEALQDARTGPPGFQWTPELDALLLRYWPTKNKQQVAKTIGCATGTCRDRYRYLTEEGRDRKAK